MRRVSGKFQRLIESMRAGAPRFESARWQRTAVHPGSIVNEPCSTVLIQGNSRSRSQPHGDGGFGGVAMLASALTSDQPHTHTQASATP
jgi:hypothetical protein